MAAASTGSSRSSSAAIYQSIEILKPNGVIASYASDAVLEPKLPFYALAYKSALVRFVLVFMMPEAAKRQAIGDLTADSRRASSATTSPGACRSPNRRRP